MFHCSLFLLFLLFSVVTTHGKEKSLIQTGVTFKHKRFTLKKQSTLTYQTYDQNQEQNKDYDTAKETFLQKKRVQLILKIKSLLDQSKKDPQHRANLLLRLANLYMDEYHFTLASIHQTYQRSLATTENSLTSPKTSAYPKFNSAFPLLKTSRALYSALLSEFPNHPDTDQIIYSLGLSFLDEGTTSTALGYLDRLTKQHPNSKFRAEALIQLGDHYFSINQARLSESYYDRVIAEKKCRRDILAYVHYKKAWCRYNLADYTNSIQQFKKAIEVEELTDRSQTFKIRSEVAKDIALPYTESKQLREAELFYLGLGGKHYRVGIESLAYLVHEKGMHPVAIQFFEKLLRLESTHPKNSSYELAILDILNTENKHSLLRDQLLLKAPLYLQSRSPWVEHNQSDTKLLLKAQTDWESQLKKYALQFHGEDQRTNNPVLGTLAASINRTYFNFIPQNRLSSKMYFYYAELLFRQKQYGNAVEYYLKSSAESKRAEEREEGLRSALISLKNQINLDRKADSESEISTLGKKVASIQEKTQAKLEYTESEKLFFQLANQYLENHSKFPKAHDLEFEIAYLQYIRGDWANALSSFKSYMATSTQKESLEQAAYLVLDIRNKSKNYASLIESCTAFLNHRHLQSKAFQLEVHQVLQQGRLKLIQEMEGDAKFAETGEEYLLFSKQGKSTDGALKEKALYNAAVNFRKAGQELRSLNTYETFVTAYPKSPFNREVLIELARGFEGMAKFEKAGEYYSRFFESHKSDPSAERALRLAGLYFWAAGNIPIAEKTMKQSISKYPGKNANLVKEDLLELYEDQGNDSKMLRTLQEMVSNSRTSKGQRVILLSRIAETMTRKYGQPLKVFLNNPRFTLNELHSIGKLDKSVADASAKLILIQLKYNEEMKFKQLRLSQYQSNIDKKFNQKLKLLIDLQNKYTKLAQLGSTWEIFANHKTANAYFELIQELIRIPPPKSLSSVEADSYRTAVTENFINPLWIKTKQIAENCITKAEQGNVYTSSTAGCRRISLAEAFYNKSNPPPNSLFLPPTSVALNWPDSSTSPIKVGTEPNFDYPYEAGPLFWSKVYYQSKYKGPHSSFEVIPEIEATEIKVPQLGSYENLKGEQLSALNKLLTDNPIKHGAAPDFRYLSLMKIVSPSDALPLINRALEKDPKSFELHNLLALCHLELKQFGAAKVIWLALKMRGFENPDLYNNLGVLSYLQGKENLAQAYFYQAIETKHQSAAGFTNLGFMALGAWMPDQALGFFQKAQSLRSSITLDTAIAIVSVQKGETAEARLKLTQMSKQYPGDYFIKQSLELIPAEMNSSETLSQAALQIEFESEDKN